MPRLTFRSLLLAAALVCAGSGIAQSQSIHPVDLDGETVNLVIPEGYCAIDLDRPENQDWFETLDLGLQPVGRPLLVFGSCVAQGGSPEASGAPVPIDAYGIYMAFTDASGTYEVWSKPREWYASSMAKSAPTIDRYKLEQLVNDRIRAVYNNPEYEVALGELHVTGYDMNAVYIFVLGTKTLDGNVVLGMAVAGSTIINQRIVVATLYRETVDPTQIDGIDRDVRLLVRQLLAANPDSDN